MPRRIFAVTTAFGLAALVATAIAAAQQPGAQEGAKPSAPGAAAARFPTNAAEFDQLFNEVKNWGRWGKDDQLGSANLITEAKRKQAIATVKEGLVLSMAHNIFQEEVPDGNGHLERTVLSVRPTGADRVGA